MQVQKEEMKEDILAAAQYEFLKRGYKSASLRTIAKKANTTIGNLYNYFDSKEAILDEIIGDIPQQIQHVFENHAALDPELFDLELNTIEKLCQVIDTYMPSLFCFDLLLRNEVIILLEGCENTRYEGFREQVYQVFYSHIAEHFAGVDETQVIGKELYMNTVVTTIIDAIIYISKNKSSYEEGVKVLVEYMKLIIIGLMSTDDMKFVMKLDKKNT